MKSIQVSRSTLDNALLAASDEFERIRDALTKDGEALSEQFEKQAKELDKLREMLEDADVIELLD